MSELRWKLAEDRGGQGAFFADEELVERHVGRGEYRGMEFFHVNARRVDAVAKLNQAGIPCGVLVAPILPGISDAAEQLREVVEACVAAGAVSVTALALHLRPGVREHFLAWLAANRPELVAEYERRYRRAYLPGKEQEEVVGVVRRLVATARGRYGPPRTPG